ncbi:MAG TPA: MBL fold metallo-hydrolase [Candidatus Krumholzibacteria bacterium]|nr:MBL fold metallo-hydrolase [Candidatus Krumholzibacteria bacterium]
MKAVIRIIVSLFAVMFVGVGLACWMAPDKVAAQFGLEAVRAAGLTSTRADLGGMFLALGVMCALGAWTGRRSALRAAALVLAAIVAGRLVGGIANGAVGVRDLVIEVTAVLLLWVLARERRDTAETTTRRSHRGLKIATVSIGVIVASAVLALLNASVEQAIFDRGAMKMTARVNTAPLADDALRVAIAGSSAPLPSRARAKACVVVFAGGKFWVVDAGPESTENLVLWGIPLSQIGGVLITHYHSDHIGDLGELQLQTWAGGRPQPLDVYGGPGVDALVDGFNMAYRLDQGYRTTHHGEKVMPSAAWGMVAHTVTLDGQATPAKDRTGPVYDDGTLRITAIEVDHSPIEPAYAYRFDYKGRSVVVTGDLKYHPPLVKSAMNADLMVSEAISRSMTHALENAANTVGRDRTKAIMHDVQDYHISPEEAAKIANDAHVRLLAFYHLLPAPDGFLTRRLFAHGVNAVRQGEWTMAGDGSMYTMPFGSTAVRIGRIQ